MKTNDRINRREFGKTAGLAAVGTALSIGERAHAADRPNVLFILVDQWRMPCWFRDLSMSSKLSEVMLAYSYGQA